MRGKTLVTVFAAVCVALWRAKQRREDTPSRDPATSSPAIEPLSGDVLRERSIALFTDGYLTIVSIVQGVALAALVTQSAAAIQARDLHPFAIAARAALVFIGIALVQYGYLWFTTVMRWSMTFRDIVIPFLLGAGEIVAAQLVDEPKHWWLALAGFGGLGGLAYSNTRSRLDLQALASGNRDRAVATFRALDALLKKLIFGCLGIALCAIAMWFLITPGPTVTYLQVLGPTSIAISTLAFVRLTETGLNQVFKIHGVARINQRQVPLVSPAQCKR